MKELFEAAFGESYCGRHLPADALWWFMHPEMDGPSTAEPPHRVFERAVAELTAADLVEASTQLAELAELVRRADRLAVVRAMREAEDGWA